MDRPLESTELTPLDRRLAQLCARCLAENPVERPQDVAAIGRLLAAKPPLPWRRPAWRLRELAIGALSAFDLSGAHTAERQHRSLGLTEDQWQTFLNAVDHLSGSQHDQ